jgi:hypothetical protein
VVGHGVGIGSGLDAVAKAFGAVTVTRTPVGRTVAAGNVAGAMRSRGKVTTLSAGRICSFE